MRRTGQADKEPVAETQPTEPALKSVSTESSSAGEAWTNSFDQAQLTEVKPGGPTASGAVRPAHRDRAHPGHMSTGTPREAMRTGENQKPRSQAGSSQTAASDDQRSRFVNKR